MCGHHRIGVNLGVINAMTKCAFCEILRNGPAEKTFVWQMQAGTVYVNRDQNFKGRCLLMLNDHVEDVTEVSPEKFASFANEALAVANSLKRAFRPDSMNIAILGHHIRHLHWHIIPRYTSDSNWGGPPWPHEYRFLTEPEYLDLSRTIRRYLRDGG